jgi:mRNA interferase MazF
MATKHSTVFQCIPLTTKLNKPKLPTHVRINSGNLKEESIALVEQEELVDIFDIKYKIGELSEDDMDEIEYAILIQRDMTMNKRLLNRLMRSNHYNFA